MRPNREKVRSAAGYGDLESETMASLTSIAMSLNQKLCFHVFFEDAHWSANGWPVIHEKQYTTMIYDIWWYMTDLWSKKSGYIILQCDNKVLVLTDDMSFKAFVLFQRLHSQFVNFNEYHLTRHSKIWLAYPKSKVILTFLLSGIQHKQRDNFCDSVDLRQDERRTKTSSALHPMMATSRRVTGLALWSHQRKSSASRCLMKNQGLNPYSNLIGSLLGIPFLPASLDKRWVILEHKVHSRDSTDLFRKLIQTRALLAASFALFIVLAW